MDYMSILWGDQLGVKTEMMKLQGIQNNFAKKILVRTQSGDKALGELGWLNLETCRRNYRLMLAHGTLKGELLSHLDDLVVKEAQNNEYYSRDKIFNRLPTPRNNWGKRLTTQTVFNAWRSLGRVHGQLMPLNRFKMFLRKGLIRVWNDWGLFNYLKEFFTFLIF